MIRQFAAALAFGTAAMATPSAAVTTYHFSQTAAAANVASGLFQGASGTPLTLDFTVANALAANTIYNFGYGGIALGDSGNVANFIASGGTAATTFASTDFPAVGTTYGYGQSTAFILHVQTNAAGAIDLYDIRISGVRAADPSQYLLFQIQHDTPTSGVNAAASANSVQSGFATGIRYCANFCGGSFGVAGGVAAVPEPATWALLIAGFGLTGAAARRSRRNLRVAA